MNRFGILVRHSDSGVTDSVASESWLELMLRDLQKHQNIDLSSKVNWLIDELGGERLPSINLAYVDLS